MSDTDRMYRLLRREGSRGVHTRDLRREGYSGNPSQRKTDIEKKYGVQIHAEKEPRNGRPGSRYTLVGVGRERDDVALGHSADPGERSVGVGADGAAAQEREVRASASTSLSVDPGGQPAPSEHSGRAAGSFRSPLGPQPVPETLSLLPDSAGRAEPLSAFTGVEAA